MDEERTGMPRWVKIAGLVAALVAVLVVVVVMLLIGGGEHGPWRHVSAGTAAVAGLR
jgi:hypothetical protein